MNRILCALIFIFILMLCNSSVLGQNLVPNPSFEDTVSCPINQDELNKAIGWMSYFHSPDYFNQCSSIFVGLPSNFAGFQFSKLGNAYAGCISFFLPSIDFREFIGVQLIQPLIIGQKYFLSFDIVMGFNTNNSIGVATNKMGANLFTIPHSKTNPVQISNHAMIYTDSIISDTLNWTQISGSFISDSAYEYLSIGNFFEDSLLNKYFYYPNAVYSYYYVDNVCLSSDSILCGTFTNVSEINLLNDITLFPNPTNGLLNLNNSNIESIKMFTALGKFVEVPLIEENSNNYVLNFSGLINGIYFIEIKFKQNFIYKKVIKI